MPTWLLEALQWLSAALTGPLGGFLGGAATFFLLEMGYKKLRERHGIAEALAAELANAADDLVTHTKDQDPHEIPGYFRISHIVFDAIASRLSDLPFEDIVSITKVYRLLDELNRMPNAWRERALNAFSMPEGHPDKRGELDSIEEGRKGFYELLSKVEKDCRGLATHLRTKHAIGWRLLIPLRLRPERQLPAGQSKKPSNQPAV